MLIFLSVRNLFRNVRRTLAILFTVALGTGALFSFEGFITGVLKELKDTTIHVHYGFGQINTEGYRETVFEDPKKHWISNGNELLEFLYGLKGVENAFPRVSLSALLKKEGITISGAGQGVDAQREAQFFHSLDVEEGKTLTNEAYGIFLGHGLAKALRASPGDLVTVIATSNTGMINRDKFTVTGIFNTGSLDFDSRAFRIQLPAAQALLKTKKIESVALALRDESDWDSVAQQVVAAFPDLEATPFHVLDKINYQHSVDWLNAQFNVVQVIILAIVVLGIFNSVSASILERKQEIGNLRANGESVFQVMQLIICEGAVLAVCGCLLGMGISYALLELFIDNQLLMPPGPGHTRQFVVKFSFEWSMVAFTLIFSLVAAIFASFFAGIKVAKMSIAKSLRSH